MTAHQEEFLKKLGELTREFGIKIGGCGCCGSPFANSLENEEYGPEYRYVADENCDGLMWKKT